ncbi:MAG: hypothetical protein E2O93_06320 [Alphaproteobacteria bacterium]|nr:MAG: hypothetical protein E2O93_06320 [Alphaproteobacteria bacterium]
MRIVWIIVGLCAATLAVAQMARPPDAPPAIYGSGLKYPDFEAIKEQAPRLPEDLPADARAAYEAAASDEACPDATDVLIEAYIADYPRQIGLRITSDFGRQNWWNYAGLKSYPRAYACFTIRMFGKAAGEYDATGRTDFRWCGQGLVSQSAELRKDPLLGALDRQIGYMGFLTHDRPGSYPFSARAVRTLLAADDRYAFVDLAPTARYVLLAILRSRDRSTAAEEKALAELSKSLAAIDISYIERNIDMGSSVLDIVAARYCGEE